MSNVTITEGQTLTWPMFNEPMRVVTTTLCESPTYSQYYRRETIPPGTSDRRPE